MTSPKIEVRIRARLASGEGIKKVARALGVGNGTVSRIKAEIAHLTWHPLMDV
jgi:DNA invertase Pin-like site-specific DNA recombinase